MVLDPWVCDALLGALVVYGFLKRTSGDAYARGPVMRTREAGRQEAERDRMSRAWSSQVVESQAFIVCSFGRVILHERA